MSWLSENGAGLIGTAVSGVSGVINNIFNRSNMKKQHEYNVDMLNRQNDYNTTMWNAQNAYNDPSAVRDRQVAAGLNPINVGENTGQSATAASSGSGSGVGLPSSTMNLENPALIQAQIDNIKQDTKNKAANTELTDAQKEQQQINNEILKATKESASAANNMENWQKFYENNGKVEAIKTAPDVIKTGYLDTWRGLSAQTANVIADTALKNSSKEVNEKQKEYINEQKEAIQKQLDLTQKSIEATLRGQDINKAIAQMNNTTAQLLKQMDVMIAKIAASANIEVAKINADLEKDFSNMLQPIFDLGQVKVSEFVGYINQGYSLYDAFKKVTGKSFDHYDPYKNSPKKPIKGKGSGW